MKIGFTYDLRDDYLAQGYGAEASAEFDRPETIDAISRALRSLGHEVECIGNVEALLPRLLRGQRWDLVFNIAEGMRGLARESLIPSLLDHYTVPYTFSDPVVLAVALHKAVAKRVVRDHDIATPDFALIETEADLGRVTLPFPLFAKPVAEGSSKGISAASRIDDARTLHTVCHELRARFGQPVLLERYLPGREFTVGLLGTGAHARVLGVLEVALRAGAERDVYSFHNKECYEDLVDYRLRRGALAGRIGQVALAAWRGLGCRDAGRVDIRLAADGTPNFVEVNPLAGLNPLRSDLAIMARLAGVAYETVIARIVDSALARVGEAPPAAVAVAG